MVLGGAQNGTTDTCCFDAGFGPTQVSCPRPNDECPLNGHTDCNGGCLYEVRHTKDIHIFRCSSITKVAKIFEQLDQALSDVGLQVRSDPTEHRPLSGGAGGMCGTDSCDDIKAALLVRIEELKVSFHPF